MGAIFKNATYIFVNHFLSLNLSFLNFQFQNRMFRTMAQNVNRVIRTSYSSYLYTYIPKTNWISKKTLTIYFYEYIQAQLTQILLWFTKKCLTENCCGNEIFLTNLDESSLTWIRFSNLLGLRYFQFTGSFFCCLTNKLISDINYL